MSGIHVGPASVAVIFTEHRGSMSCTIHKDKLDAVLNMIDNGSLGGGVGYGCKEHIAALAEVQRQINDTLATIEYQNASEASHTNPQPGV